MTRPDSRHPLVPYQAVVRLYADTERNITLYETNVDFEYVPGFLSPREYAAAAVPPLVKDLLADPAVKTWSLIVVQPC